MTRAKEYQEFWKDLSTHVDAGISFFPAFDQLSIAYPKDTFIGQIILQLNAGMTDGCMLSEAMQRIADLFTEDEIKIVKLHEELGSLDAGLRELAANKLATKSLEYKMFWKIFGITVASGRGGCIEGLESCKCTANGKLEKAAAEAKQSLIMGSTLAEALKATGMFSDYEVSKVRLGEYTGSLEEQVNRIIELC